ncbi:MAG: NnrS family protein, partial [Alphaproteobacteria bacterium]
MTEQQLPDLERLMAGNPASGILRSFALFEYGFRPFFLMAGLYAALALVLWLLAWFGTIELGGAWPGASWHGHEMFFGFATAAVAGFMLTAVPGWTNTPALRGPPLMALAALWLAGRLAMWAGAALAPLVVALVDLAFLPLLAVAVAAPL